MSIPSSQIQGIASITGLGSIANQATALDTTPNSVNWRDVEADYPATADTNDQTINGITTDIKVYAAIVNNIDGATLEYSKNSGSWTSISYTVDGYMINPTQISINNGDTLRFRATAPSGFGSSSTIDIMQNVSGGDVKLDTITLTVFGNIGPE